ncbi:uncharacterized protein [Salvelinus alpinus]|uniref:uncharacterized protein n=1 Tax=Salvelinus alpinus TaxID=8036 RepID=UPI0039FD0A3D
MAGLQCVKMDTIYNLLQQHRLDAYHHKFLTLGVQDERDFTDGVNGEDLDKMGFSQVEKNRFEKMKDFIQRLRVPQQAMPVQKLMESFQLWYTYPHCPELKEIRDMDPATNTVEDLMLRICHQEGIENSKAVCLYTVDGMPLTDDPFFNTWSLKDRHKNECEFLSQPGSWEVTKSSYRTRAQIIIIIIINNFALYLTILHLKPYLFINNCE